MWSATAGFILSGKVNDASMTFLTNRIRRNKENRELKAQENTAFEAVLYVLNNVDVPQSLAWDYH